VAEIYNSLLSRYYNSAGSFGITNLKSQFLACFTYFEEIKIGSRDHLVERVEERERGRESWRERYI
jgi:hypothetical protein